MATNPPSGHGFTRRLEELIQQFEAELRDAVTYVNDAVVPQVRRESVSTMRTLSEKLRNLADRIDRQTPSDSNRDRRPC